MRDCILHGDCLEVLRGIPDNSIDAMVTDPPAGISFMGKEWDSNKGERNQWIAWLSSIMQEALRCLKPGGHALVWALPRTSHWTATALEDAGFEIRDVVTHAFGSGFPKSLDVSKAIDKLAGAEREVIGIRRQRANSINSVVPMNASISEVEHITAPATDAARQWQGYGSALKPASEHWILARKPLAERNLASNVLAWGTGGLNIDASRVNYADGNVVRSSRHNVTIGGNGIYGGGKAAITGGHDAGRWPPNFLLSHSEQCTPLACAEECAVRLLDEQGGYSKSNIRPPTGEWDKPASSFALHRKDTIARGHDDAGGVSRFFPVFYAAKASRRDRSSDGAVNNIHPTCKSTELMRWLCRLIGIPGGIILDPFAGSGSTLVACVQEGFHFIGIEQSAEYVTIARARVAHAQREPAKPRAKVIRLPKRPKHVEQLALFA